MGNETVFSSAICIEKKGNGPSTKINEEYNVFFIRSNNFKLKKEVFIQDISSPFKRISYNKTLIDDKG